MPIRIDKWGRRWPSLTPTEYTLCLLLLIPAGFTTWRAFEPLLVALVTQISPYF